MTGKPIRIGIDPKINKAVSCCDTETVSTRDEGDGFEMVSWVAMQQSGLRRPLHVIAGSSCDEAIQPSFVASGLPRRFAKGQAAKQLFLTSQ
jgi:hypothetical protein